MTEAELQDLSGRLNPLPRHVGIIMDGNGRYATRRGLPRSMGHRAGTERLRGIIRLSSDLGIEALSLYAFSTENWKRPKPEVDTLFSIFMEYFIKEVDALHKNNVAIRAMGDIEALPEKVCRECLAAMEKTGSNTGLKLNIGLNYGGRAETLHAVKSIAGDIISGKLNIEDIDEGSMMQRLYTSGLPDVDLVIRTGGEKRLSNFMLLQSAYAELIFTDTLWPDFSDECYIAALEEFAHRNRRYGGLEGK